MDAYKNACNYVSEYIWVIRNLNFYIINDALYYDLRTRFNLRANMAQSVIKTVIAKYKTIQTNENEWIQPYFKKPQYELVFGEDYSIVKGLFNINTVNGRIKKIPFEVKSMRQYFDGTWKFGTAKLIYKHGKWFLHISCSKEIDLPEKCYINNIVGIDLGVNFTAVS